MQATGACYVIKLHLSTEPHNNHNSWTNLAVNVVATTTDEQAQCGWW